MGFGSAQICCQNCGGKRALQRFEYYSFPRAKCLWVLTCIRVCKGVSSNRIFFIQRGEQYKHNVPIYSGRLGTFTGHDLGSLETPLAKRVSLGNTSPTYQVTYHVIADALSMKVHSDDLRVTMDATRQNMTVRTNFALFSSILP